ncbi:hypothetical protein M758_4G224900 [Ceratodon purpureus]|uniref:Uncharacterized protein n=1 Tax=Ceratodon purpureus TaxID=3225 RepID=A0A8T0IDR6_CERPU|nr:hypothetical protein KC19_4G220500 [Ceratodon purpureus]KAG0620552.1 hypothetical protein M758_4G224900 [Ceratodon purpureus]
MRGHHFETFSRNNGLPAVEKVHLTTSVPLKLVYVSYVYALL